MKSIIIAPYAKKLRNKEQINAKNYPWFKEVVQTIKELNSDVYIIQIGIEGEDVICNEIDKFVIGLPMDQIIKKIKECTIFVSVDSFVGHLGASIEKKGIVIFGKSDPNIFGHPQNINILKDRGYLRENQFYIWEDEPFDEEAFVDPEFIITAIIEEINLF